VLSLRGLRAVSLLMLPSLCSSLSLLHSLFSGCCAQDFYGYFDTDREGSTLHQGLLKTLLRCIRAVSV